MVSVDPCINFLGFPPGKAVLSPALNIVRMLLGITEIRNLIYAFTINAATGAKGWIVPCLALAQSCRQIRYECRPMCLKADVLIDWKNILAYLNLFYPTRDGVIENVKLASERIIIFTDPYPSGGSKTDWTEFNLLLIFKLGLANEDLHGDITAKELKSLLSADVEPVQKLLAHRNPIGLLTSLKAGSRN
ncbi:hypothetical protein SVAN01_09549 [Stagonosporopsis vannaccii]|nr:hypothetical protein SVAN01_09549 [Stagonosporopsis vannaccii]